MNTINTRKELEAQYGAGRRRVYWEREGGLIPPNGIAQTTVPIVPTLFSAVLAGVGLGVGFAIVKKINK